MAHYVQQKYMSLHPYWQLDNNHHFLYRYSLLKNLRYTYRYL